MIVSRLLAQAHDGASSVVILMAGGRDFSIDFDGYV